MDLSKLERVYGLRPEVWLIIGAGFAREDMKSLILSQGRGFVGDAVLTLQEISLKLTQLDKKQVLNSFSRQEVLRLLLSEARIIDQLPELARIKRQKNFLRRLDGAFQSARMAFAHEEEEEVYSQRLNQTLGESPLRSELKRLAQAYEVWLEASSCTDLPMLMRKATQILKTGWPAGSAQPKEIWYFSTQTSESLERDFWDALAQQVQVRTFTRLDELDQIQSDSQSEVAVTPGIVWQKWHTLDDAAEYLADELISSWSPNGSSSSVPSGAVDAFWHQSAVLIPDIPSIRRSLGRALSMKGIPLADFRDPTRLHWDESLKRALLPLDVVASRYERTQVVSFISGRFHQPKTEQVAEWILEMNHRGIRQGLSAYSGGVLADLFSQLQSLHSEFGGRRTCQEVAGSHAKFLKTSGLGDWLISFLDQIWQGLIQDLDRVGQAERKAPLLLWVERLRSRLSEASPPVERIKTRGGLSIFRLQQAPILLPKRLWVFGIPPQWLEGARVGSYWLNDREREILSTEFSVRSTFQVGQEYLEVLKTWVEGVVGISGEIVFLDAEYQSDGRERESILPIFQRLKKEGTPFLNGLLPSSPRVMGAHSRFQASYGRSTLDRKCQPYQVDLPPLRQTSQPFEGADQVLKPELTATLLDRLSRCSFQALGYHRWNLKDVREPETELWPDARGNLLHEAVRLLLKSKDQNGQFQLSAEGALRTAWLKKRPKGLIQSRRIEDYVQFRLNQILKVFCEKESEYQKKSNTQSISLDESSFKIDYPEFSLVGKPDRIDQHSDGLFVMDYKTSGSLPSGMEMMDYGYRLQLPFYAIAIEKSQNQPVIGLQFIELDRKGARKSGIFFQPWNGRQEGALTQARSNSKSLFTIEPAEAWQILERYLLLDVNQYLRGRFEANPRAALFGKKDQECGRCSLSDLCGLRRRHPSQEEGVP